MNSQSARFDRQCDPQTFSVVTSCPPPLKHFWRHLCLEVPQVKVLNVQNYILYIILLNYNS